ncbi:MAG: maltose acetyltransferase domain-containing protein [Lactobacillaceae bacterium]
MSEKEKMLSGKIYNPADPELVAMRLDAQNLFKTYNNLPEEHCDREKVFKQLVPNTADDCEIKGPVYFDYGKFIKLGERVFINYNFTVLDSAIVTIGSNVILVPMFPFYHPFIL